MQEITKKYISLPKGGILEVDASPKFLEIVRKQFNLNAQQRVSDDHIRMYIWGAFNNAMDKAEKGA
jgi:hypothetical protein